MLDMDIIDHVAAALDSESVLTNLTLNNNKFAGYSDHCNTLLLEAYSNY